MDHYSKYITRLEICNFDCDVTCTLSFALTTYFLANRQRAVGLVNGVKRLIIRKVHCRFWYHHLFLWHCQRKKL